MLWRKSPRLASFMTKTRVNSTLISMPLNAIFQGQLKRNAPYPTIRSCKRTYAYIFGNITYTSPKPERRWSPPHTSTGCYSQRIGSVNTMETHRIVGITNPDRVNHTYYVSRGRIIDPYTGKTLGTITGRTLGTTTRGNLDRNNLDLPLVFPKTKDEATNDETTSTRCRNLV